MKKNEKIIQIENIGGDSQIKLFLTNKGRVLQMFIDYINSLNPVLKISDITPKNISKIK